MHILQRWYDEVWSQGREESIPELLAPDVVVHGITDSEGRPITGLEAFKTYHKSLRATLSEMEIEVADIVTEGDRSACRCVVKARHTGDGLGIAPTGRHVLFTGMSFVRVRDGQIVEGWNNFDFMTMLQQLQ